MSHIVTLFDASITDFVTQMVGRSDAFDMAVVAIQATSLVLEVLVAAYWWAWFRRGDPKTVHRTRGILIMSVIGVVGAVGLSFLLKSSFPSRGRPLHELGSFGPHRFALDPHAVGFHAAFPSHHEMVAFALVTGLLLVSWRVGVAASLWAAVVMGGPEVYLGLHYPSDLVGGAALGVAVVLIFNLPLVREVVAERIVAVSDDWPAIFYPAWFTLTVQTATLFGDGVPLAHWLTAVLRH